MKSGFSAGQEGQDGQEEFEEFEEPEVSQLQFWLSVLLGCSTGSGQGRYLVMEGVPLMICCVRVLSSTISELLLTLFTPNRFKCFSLSPLRIWIRNFRSLAAFLPNVNLTFLRFGLATFEMMLRMDQMLIQFFITSRTRDRSLRISGVSLEKEGWIGSFRDYWVVF